MSPRLLYITSPSYSGSTLLTILLAEHTAISTVGELKASAFGSIEQYNCSCGRLLRECAFWQDIESRVRTEDPSFNLHNWRTHFRPESGMARKVLGSGLKAPSFERIRDLAVRLLPGVAQTKQRILENNERVVSAVVAATNTSAFIDGSKDPIRARYLLQSKLWETSVITLIRDGRGFCASYMKHMSAPIGEAISEWKAKVLEMEHLQKIAGRRSIVVRYEDLCDEPLTVINRILNAAGLEPLTSIDFPISKTNRHIFGNAMRLREIEAVVTDEKWRSALTPEDLEQFYTEAGEINERYGYSAR